MAINDRSVKNVNHADIVDTLKGAGNTVQLVSGGLVNNARDLTMLH